ncbi:MAG: MFS transporter [Acidimicrobiales bacterium]|jgi:predicted MFS family arabinose efflux permease
MTEAVAVATKQRKGAFPIWVVITVGGVLTAVSLGIRSTFGVFLDPVVEGVLDGVQGPWGIAIAVQSIMWGISQPIAGAVSDRYGGAITFAGGTVLYAIALLLMSTAQSAFMVIFAGGFLTGIAIGAASFAVVLSAVGRMVSPARRSMALGVVSAAGSMGQFILVPLARVLIDRWSWQDTFVAFAVIAAVTIVLTPSLRGSATRHFPEPAETATDRTLRQELRRAARAKPYLLLNAAFFVCGFHVTFISAYLPRYGEDLGHKGTATTALALIGLFNVFGSLAAGALGGKYSKTKLLGGIYAARAFVISVYILLPAEPVFTLLFGAAIGLLWLSTVPLTSGMVTELFGTTHSGALFGIVFFSHQLGAFAGALGGSWAHDRYGSYDLVWWIAVALGVAGLLIHMSIEEGPIQDPPLATVRAGDLVPAGGLASVMLVIGIGAVLLPALSASDNIDGLLGWCFSVIDG